MYIHQVYLSTYSPDQALTGHITVKGETAKFDLDFLPEEIAAIFPILETAFARHKAELVKTITAPLETPAQLCDFREID